MSWPILYHQPLQGSDGHDLQRYSLSLIPHTKLDFVGTRRPAPGPGTFMKIGPVGTPTAPKDLRGNYRHFIKLDD